MIAPHHQAAFINAIREEGTKSQACDYLQKTWNELCEARAILAEAHAEGRREALREALTFIDGATLIVAPETASQRIGADSIRGQLCEVVKSLLDAEAPTQPKSTGRWTVPANQTPLDGKLGHPLIDVFNEGIKARDSGVPSPYHGHSLEHCIHAMGWVQRDLRLALDETKQPKLEALAR